MATLTKEQQDKITEIKRQIEQNEQTLGEITKDLNPNKKNKKKFGLFVGIGALAIAVASTIAIKTNNNDSKNSNVQTNNAKSTTQNAESKNILQTLGIQAKLTPIYAQDMSPELKSYLEKIGSFDIDPKLKDNQISRVVAQKQYKEQEYLLALASEAEGFRSHIYNDNIGFAFGNGWNISMQNEQYNTKIAKMISNDTTFINKITVLSGKISDRPISSDYKDVRISPQNSIQVTAFMAENFKNEGVLKHLSKTLSKNAEFQKQPGTVEEKTLKFYNGLEPNERAAINYHAYKVGAAGFGKYKTLLGEIVDYGFKKEKTIEDKQNVAKHFTYSYMMNGERKNDIRASALVGSMFMSPVAFGHIIKSDVAPKNTLASVPQFKEHNIDVNAKELVIPDPVGDYRAELEAKGVQISIKIQDVPFNIEEQRKREEHLKMLKMMGKM